MKIEFYIGAGKDRDGKPIPQVEAWEIQAKIRKLIAAEFGGFTEIPGCAGEWEGIREAIYHFVVLTEHEPAAANINRIAADLRDIARPTCIAVNITASTVNFI